MYRWNNSCVLLALQNSSPWQKNGKTGLRCKKGLIIFFFFLLLFLFHSKCKLSTFAQVVTSNSETIVIIETTTATNWQA